MRLRSVAAAARAIALYTARALRRTARRLYQLYIRPVELFEEVKLAPDALPPALLLAAGLALQTLSGEQLVRGVYEVSGGAPEELLARFYSTLAAFVSLRAAALFVFWFIAFVICWLVMYLLGSRVEGFTVFSAVGYILSSSLATFAVYCASYALVNLITPHVRLIVVRGAYPQTLAWAAYEYRLDVTSSAIGVRLPLVLDAASYFGTAWSVLLTGLAFRKVGDLSWKRTAAGSAAFLAATWFIASFFRAAGML